ncbi:acyl-CoA thioesterase [Pedobacter sp. JY14-1]|uniref:acyl-CoA thioesterase n=1 Tax=Pedobacter sp. JY14-1 TaxID=3034151 RepID=UPI0023E165F5|nr:acyl-CoA thioesterase [Pedobacter sp. JY14-1]
MKLQAEPIILRWSDLDPNFHMRHSSYYDLASQHRINVLHRYGVTLEVMEREHFAPVLFREECVFMREIRPGDVVYIDFEFTQVSEDRSKWTIVHEFKDERGKIKARLTVEGAWIDTKLRKLVRPVPQVISDAFAAMQLQDGE